MTQDEKVENKESPQTNKVRYTHNPETETKVLQLHKEGHKPSKIRELLGGCPGVPKIKRIIAKGG